MRDSEPRPAVLVTGASSGIGRETALRYARRGAAVALAARGAEPLAAVAEECRRAGARDVLFHPVDVGEDEQVRALLDAVVERFGSLDIVVHAAAVTAFGRFEDVPVDVFDAVVRTNLCGTANLARAAVREFRRRRRGQLVLVGSLLGRAAMPYQGAYVASKFAVSGLVRLLRQENRDLPGVVVHGIYPGPVDTPIYPRAANYQGVSARPLPPTYAATRVARAVVRTTDRGRPRERNVSWASGPTRVTYRLMPRLFDAVAGALVRNAGFSAQPAAPSSGNVFGREREGTR